MALTKKQRATLREKFGGRCAYCGCELGEKWHADHIEHIGRTDWFARNGGKPQGHDYPERDTLENMNPACPPCNIDKHTFSLEGWRQVIQRSNDVLLRDVSTFRRAVRYGLVTLNSAPVIFYFERAAAHQPTKEKP
ncbi:HNH endonuclease signature motif containing protein [Aquabacterium sp.]|uniref:HNH endonuclease signature motif containing protein n=1 Tax=Aquabacterium sp. TaxID=1872578 RepID=UPI0035C67966